MKTLIITCAIGATALTPAAFAGDSFPFVFQYDAASVQTQDGAQETHDRLKERVEAACGHMSSGTRGLAQKKVQNACVNDVMKDSLEKIVDQQEQVIATR